MKTTKQTAGQTATNTTEKLIKFVNQRPGLDFANYGDVKLYRSESAEITKDRRDFYELLGLATRRIDGFDAKLKRELLNTSGRLTMKEGGEYIEYCTGQYFPTEYRPAACRVIVSLLWNDYRDEKDANGQAIYKDGNEIRKAIRRNLSRRCGKNYFN